MEKLTLKSLESRIAMQDTLLARLMGIVESMGQTATPVLPCDCNMVTCAECLARVTGQTFVADVKTSSPTVTPVRVNTGQTKVTGDSDFLTVVVPYMATRVSHNVKHGVDCKTDKLTAIGASYGVTDYRFMLTTGERAILKKSRVNAGLTLEASLIALAGAVERKR